MSKVLFSIFILSILSLTVTNAALSCYSCNDCGTIWDASKANIVQTGSANAYCRKIITGNYVTKDAAASCSPLNILGHGIFCCLDDLCNSANQKSMTTIHLGISVALFWAIYSCIF